MKFALIGNGTYFNCSNQLKKYDVIIALDGGANHCRKMRVTPHYSIGDGDSITVRLKTFLQDKNQNTTDLQKGVQFCKKLADKKPYTIDLFCCASEERLDHTQSAIQMLVSHPRIQQLFTPTTSIHYVQRGSNITLQQSASPTVSLVPVTQSAQVLLQGFRWSGKFTLRTQTYSGISNRITHSPANITVLAGKILVFRL